MVKNSELRMKDVIDIRRGKKLGYIDDVDIDLDKGRIKAFVIPAQKNIIYNFFSKKKDLVINWDNIIKIGEDVILVEIKKEEQLDF